MTAKDVAEYFIYRATIDEDAIDNLKLQKLLYYAQGFSLAMFDEPLFSEQVEKWTHGPVVPEIYHLFKEYAAGSLPEIHEIDEGKYGEEILGLLDEVYSVYGQFSGWALRNMTHSEPPWQDAQSGGVIEIAAMKAFFKTRVEADA